MLFEILIGHGDKSLVISTRDARDQPLDNRCQAIRPIRRRGNEAAGPAVFSRPLAWTLAGGQILELWRGFEPRGLSTHRFKLWPRINTGARLSPPFPRRDSGGPVVQSTNPKWEIQQSSKNKFSVNLMVVIPIRITSYPLSLTKPRFPKIQLQEVRLWVLSIISLTFA